MYAGPVSRFDVVLGGLLLGLALFGYLRAARTVGERWAIPRWALVGGVSILSVLALVAFAVRRYPGALVLAALVVAWLVARSRLRRGSPSP